MRTDQEQERVRQLTNERTEVRQKLALISNSLRFAKGDERKRLYNQSVGLQGRIRQLNAAIGVVYERKEG